MQLAFTPHSHYPGLLTMDGNPGCRIQVRSCSHYCSKPWANLSSRLCMLNNDVQKQARKYSLFGAYQSNAEAEAAESSEAKNKAEEAIQ